MEVYVICPTWGIKSLRKSRYPRRVVANAQLSVDYTSSEIRFDNTLRNTLPSAVSSRREDASK